MGKSEQTETETGPAAEAAERDTALQQHVFAMVLERSLPYPRRLTARAEIPPGTRAEFDQRLRIRGTLSKGQSTTVKPTSTVLCRVVLAALARELEIEPQRLHEALRVAAAAAVDRKRQYLGDKKIDLDDPHVQAINHAQAEVIAGLKQSRLDGSVRVEAEIKTHKGSAIAIHE